MLNWKIYSPQQSQARAVHIQMTQYNPIIFQHDSNSIPGAPQTQHVLGMRVQQLQTKYRERGLTDLKLTLNLAGSFTVWSKRENLFVSVLLH